MKEITNDEFIQLLVYIIFDGYNVDFDTITLKHIKDIGIDTSERYTVSKDVLTELYNKYKGDDVSGRRK